MATKDITDAQVVRAVAKSKDGSCPLAILEAETSQPEKVCFRAMERAHRRGYLEYGVSLTESGAELARGSAEAQFRSSLNELDAIPEIIKKFICSGSLQPSSVYKDSQEHWCFDWDDDALECCVYTKYLAAENRLLVIVDTNNGSFLRLPCNLIACEPLKHLRLALKIAVGAI